MSRAVDILINGVDNFSKTAEEASDSGEDLANELEDSFKKITMAVVGATTALEIMNRDQREMTETLERTAYFVNSTTDELRHLAVSISNVTRPTSDVVDGFNALMKRGVQNEEHMARLAIQYDTLADAMGEKMLPVIKQVAPMFSAFGDNIAGVERYGDQLVHTFESTALELADFNRVMRRSRIYLTNIGLTMDDALAVLLGLGQESQNSAQAMYTLQRAARRADGDMEKFLEITGITKEELAGYKEELDNAEGAMDDFAKMHEDSFTPIQKILSLVERLQLQYADTIDALTTIFAIMAGGLVTVFVLSTLVNSLAGNIKLLLNGLSYLSTALDTTIALLLGKVAVVIALAGAFVYLAETMTNEFKTVERGVESLGRTVDAVSKVISGELGDSWESIEDVPQQVLDRWEKTIKDTLDMDIDIAEDFDSLAEFQSFLEQAQTGLENELMNMEDEGGIFTKFFQSSFDKLTPFLNNQIDKLEDWLFDTLDAMDFEAFDGEMGEIIENAGTETEVGITFTAEDIANVLSEVEREIANVDEQLEAGTIDSKFEVLTGYADATKQGIQDLLKGGLEPTSAEVNKLMQDFTDYASQLESSGESTEELQERANYLNDSFAELLKSGINPNTKGYQELKQEVKDANLEMGNISDPDEQLAQRDKIIEQYQKEIENIEQLAEEKRKLGQEYDEEAEKQRVYEQALRDLIPLYDISEQGIADLVEKIGGYDGELAQLQSQMQGTRDEISALNVLDEALGDTMDLSSEKVRSAESAIDVLTQAFVDGIIDIETYKNEMEFLNDVIASNEPNNYADKIENLNTQLENINKMEELEVIGEDEANQKRLNNVNRQLELMIENEEHINEETGELVPIFKELREEQERLQEATRQQVDATEEIAHGWGRVLDTIKSNVSEAQALKDVYNNIKNLDLEKLKQQFSAQIRPTLTMMMENIQVPDMLKKATSGVSGVIQDMMPSFQFFGSVIKTIAGPLGTILSVLMPLLEQTEQFGYIMERISVILEPLFSVLGELLEAFYPIIHLIEILSPLIAMLAQVIVKLIEPLIRALFPVFRVLGIAATYVGQIFFRVAGFILKAVGTLVEGIGKAINAIPFISTSLDDAGRDMRRAGSDLDDSADEMGDIRDTLRDLDYDDLKDAKEEEKENTEDVNEALTNVPQGYNIALRRFQAGMSAVSNAQRLTNSSNRLSSASNSGAQQQTTYQSGAIQITIVSNDPKEIWRKLSPYLKGKRFRETGTTVESTSPYS